jgi:4-amino-4-deoxy-L-arabinose transferase-like glycosyltransferase
MILLLALAAAAILWITPFGVGVTTDSVVYLVGARHLARGLDFSLPSVDSPTRLITHYAPFYSILLAAGELAGVDALTWGRILNTLLFVASLFLTLQIILNFAPKKNAESVITGLLLAGLLLTPFFVLELFATAWSEALFVFLFLLSLQLVGKYLEAPSGRLLIFAGLATGAAFLTRYAGAALLIAFCLVIWLFSRQNTRRRLTGALTFGALAIAPQAFWLLRNLFLTGTTTSRELSFHPFGKTLVWQAMTTMSSWLLAPETTPTIVKGAILVLAAGGIAYGLWRKVVATETSTADLRRRLSESLPGIVLIILVFIPIYFIFLGVSLDFFDANIPMDGRIFITVYFSILILTGYLLQQFVPANRSQRWLKNGVLVLGLALISGNVFNSAPSVTAAHQYGLGFENSFWQSSDLLAALKNVPQDLAVYTNVPESIRLYTNRKVELLPRKFDPANQQTNPNYANDLETVLQRVRGGEAVIVYYNVLERPNLTGNGEIQSAPGLLILDTTNDGVIYAAQAFR